MAASAAVLAVVGVFVTRANMRFITPTTVMYHTAGGYHTAFVVANTGNNLIVTTSSTSLRTAFFRAGGLSPANYTLVTKGTSHTKLYSKF